MDTKMQCRNCGRKMSIWEFIPYVEVYLTNLAVETGLAALILVAIKNYFSAKQETRGIINDQMTSFAHMLKVKCPKCQQLNVWDPISEEDEASEIEKFEASKKNARPDRTI